MRNLLVFFLLLANVPAQAAEKEPAYDRVVSSGTLRCGYGISPPNLVADPNTKQLSGLDYDIWREIGKELGLKIEWAEEAGWGNFIEGLRTGRYDAFCSMLWPDEARAKFLSLSEPLLFSFLNAYVRADDHRFDGGLESINTPEVTIPAIEGDVSVAMAQKRFPVARTLMLPQTATVSDMFLSVMTKKADVIFIDQAMFLVLEKEHKGVLRKLENTPPSHVFASYYGVAAGEYRLRDMISLAVRTMINDGRMEALAHEYSPDYVLPKKDF